MSKITNEVTTKITATDDTAKGLADAKRSFEQYQRDTARASLSGEQETARIRREYQAQALRQQRSAQMAYEAELTSTRRNYQGTLYSASGQVGSQMSMHLPPSARGGAGAAGRAGGAGGAGGVAAAGMLGGLMANMPKGALNAIKAGVGVKVLGDIFENQNDINQRWADGEVVTTKDRIGAFASAIPGANIGWNLGKAGKEWWTQDELMGRIDAKYIERSAAMQDKKTAGMLRNQSTRMDAEFQQSQYGLSSGEQAAQAARYDREKWEREFLTKAIQENGGVESEDLKRMRAVRDNEVKKAERAAKREAENNAGAHTASMDAIRLNAMGRGVDAAEVMARQRADEVTRNAEQIRELAGGRDTEGTREAKRAEEQAWAELNEVAKAAAREKKFIIEDSNTQIETLQSEFWSRELERTGRGYEAQQKMAEQAHRNAMAAIKRREEEAIRHRPEMAGTFRQTARLEEQRAGQQLYQSNRHAAESEYGRREGMQSRLASFTDRALGDAAMAGQSGAYMAQQRLRVKQQYASERSSLSEILRSESASAEEKQIAEGLLGGLDKRETKAMKMAGYRGPTSGLADGSQSDYGSGLAARSNERAQNAMDRQAQLTAEMKAAIDRMCTLMEQNSQPIQPTGSAAQDRWY